MLLLLFAANLSNAVNLGRLNAQACPSQPLIQSGVTYPSNLRGQILGVSLNSLPPQTIGGLTFTGYFSAANNHYIGLKRSVNGNPVPGGVSTHWSSVNMGISGSYLYTVPNATQVSVRYDFAKSPTPSNEDMLEGVTAWDLSLITQHIMALTPFSSPYQYIAGDVNNSKTVTNSDWQAIRFMILGQYTSWQQISSKTTNWRYMPFGYFTNFGWANQWSSNPLTVPAPTFPDYLNTYNGTLHAFVNPDFLTVYASAAAIKAGDTSLDAYEGNCFTNEEVVDREAIQETDFRNIYL